MYKVINKYLVFGFLKTFLNVTLVAVALGVILNLFEEIEFFKNLNASNKLPYILTMMFIPNLVISKLLPFIIFISSMWYIVSIKSKKDLLSLKVFGFSNLKIVVILSVTAFLIGLITILAVNPVTSVMIKSYEKTKAQYSKDIEHLVTINKNGVWIKEKHNNKLMITTAKSLSGNYLSDVTIYMIGDNNKILERIESKSINISNFDWELRNVKIFNIKSDGKPVYEESLSITSVYNVKKLNELYKNLDTISFFELINERDKLIEKGYNKEALNEKLNVFLSIPPFLSLMVVLASIFTIGSINKVQNLYYIFVAILSCAIIYFFKDLSIVLGQTNRISLTLAVWMPVIAITLFCSIGVLQINEK